MMGSSDQVIVYLLQGGGGGISLVQPRVIKSRNTDNSITVKSR